MRKKTQPQPATATASPQLLAENRSLQRELELSRQRYVDLYEFAPVGYATLDRNGVIREINLTGASLLHRERARLLNKPLLPLVARKERRKLLDYLSLLRQQPGVFTTELFFPGANHKGLLLQLTSSRRQDVVGRAVRFHAIIRDVTDFAAAERARHDAEAHLKFVADNTPVMLVRCSRDLRYQFVNRAYADFLGLPPEKIVGRHIADVLGVKALKAIRPYVKKALQGERLEYDLEIPYARQGPRHMRVGYAPDRDAQGHVRGWVAAISDITERKREEKWMVDDLRATRHLNEVGNLCARADTDFPKCLQTILDAAIALAAADRGNIQIFDPAADVLRIVAHRGFKKPFLKFFATVDASQAASCKVALRTARRVIVEDVTRSEIFAGKPALPVLLAAGVRACQSTPLISSTGNVLGVISTHFSRPHRPSEPELLRLDLLGRQAADYLERKSAEERQVYLAAIVQSSSDPIISKTLDGIITSWNPGAEAMFEYRAEEMVGASILKLIPPDRHVEETDILARLRRGQRIEHCETVRVAKSGRRIAVSLTISPVRNSAGKIIGASKIIHDITERKHAEELLRESEARFRTLASQAPVGIFMSKPNGDAIFVNQKWCEMAGRAAKKSLGKGWLKAVHPADRKRIQSGWRQAVGDKDSSTAEFRFRRPDGTVRWMHGHATRLQDAKGETGGYIGTVTDITESRRAQALLQNEHVRLERGVRERTAELQKSEAKIQAILDNSPAMIFLKDAKGRYLHVNRKFESAFRFKPRQVIGKTDAQIFPRRQAATYRANDREVLRSGVPRSFDEVALHDDGPHSSIVTKYPLRDTAGKVYAVGGIVTDITERRHMEEKLRESEQGLADFFEQAPLGLLWISAAGRITRVNHAQLELLDRTAKQCLQRPFTDFFADPELAVEALRRLAEKQTLQNIRARLVRPDGAIRHVLMDANGFWRKDKLVYSRWFIRDITHRVELEQEILAISDREQQRLGHDLHDDLCQQLSGIEFLSQSLAGQLAPGAPPESARAREIARMIRQSIEHTRELARGLSPVDLADEGLMFALQELARRTERVFQIRCNFRCPRPVSISPETVGIHLYRMAQEAVSNAIKHGKTRRIDIGLVARPNQIVLAVRDNGVGFPVKLRSRKGMGLRVMQYRSSVLGGSLMVQRRVNGGTSVVCTVKTNSVRPSARNS